MINPHIHYQEICNLTLTWVHLSTSWPLGQEILYIVPQIAMWNCYLTRAGSSPTSDLGKEVVGLSTCPLVHLSNCPLIKLSSVSSSKTVQPYSSSMAYSKKVLAAVSLVSCPGLFQESIGLILSSFLTNVLWTVCQSSILSIPSQIAVDCKSVHFFLFPDHYLGQAVFSICSVYHPHLQ